MVSSNTESGYRNVFGFYDRVAKEIVLKRPCIQKKDALEAYSWADEARETGLLKVSMGVGIIESFLEEDCLDSIYASARVIMKEIAEKNKCSDANILVEILIRLEKCPDLRELSLRCFSFVNEPLMFDMLLRAIKSHKKMRVLDLAGCFFDSEQLLELSSVIAESTIAHIVWPESEMNEELVDLIVEKLKYCINIVIIRGAPAKLSKVACDNRKMLFDMAKSPLALSKEDIVRFKECADSIGIALNYEHQRLLDMQKNIEVILALH